MIENAITVHPFSAETLGRLICPDRLDNIPPQVDYLARYCARLGARTLVHERHYMDRHYVDEYALYYSRMLSPPPNHVARIHFFKRDFDETQFARWLERSTVSAADREAVQAELSAGAKPNDRDGYLGYCSVRPVTSVPIGRTILSTPGDDTTGLRRDIWATNRHDVHIANLCLRVDGLAFQQQDVAVGACATAALWSALARSARMDGMRAPTPAEISEAATRAARPPVRGLLSASTGLTVTQLCEATRSLGFTPEVISAMRRPESFVGALHAYLQSGIPVVLALRGSGLGHAVAATGFQCSSSEHPGLSGTIPSFSSRMTKLYIHDDRLGPYARAYIAPFNCRVDATTGDTIEGLSCEIEWPGKQAEMWLVDSAVVPVYPKLRMSVRSLMALAELTAGLVEPLVGPKRARELRVDLRYERGGEYLSRLSGRLVDPNVAGTFVRRVSFSRWIAIVRWHLAEQELLEFVYDTTDIVRTAEIQNRELLRAIVCLQDGFRKAIRPIADELQVLTG